MQPVLSLTVRLPDNATLKVGDIVNHGVIYRVDNIENGIATLVPFEAQSYLAELTEQYQAARDVLYAQYEEARKALLDQYQRDTEGLARRLRTLPLLADVLNEVSK